MATSLNDLLGDGRLERLFSNAGRDCALQLWVLRIRHEDGIENRFLYGRLLPYNYSSNTWYATDDDQFQQVGMHHAQVIRLSLYLKNSDTAVLLRRLSDGHNLTHVSNELKLTLPSHLAARVGTTAVGVPVVYRPVAYLLNRDAPGRNVPSSPHGGAGAFSASVSQTDKLSLFRVGDNFEDALATFIVDQMNFDTGMDFAGRDIDRIGDLELLVFPTLDDSERELLTGGWQAVPGRFSVRFNPTQLPHYNIFHIRLCITNDSKLIYASLATVECPEGGEIECEFDVPVQIRPIADGHEIEIYGSRKEEKHSGTLCCRWGIGYIREVTINGHLLGNGGGSVQMDWLERVTKSASASQRLKAAQAINQGQMGFSTHAGGRQADQWVPTNREVRSLLATLHPPRSEGRFFDRLSDGDGLGRLEFVEWIKHQLVMHQNHQVLIFDPYFEDAGVGLIVPNAGDKGDYIVFTTLPKPPKPESWCTLALRHLKNWWARETPPPVTNRVNNLLAACERLRPLLKGVKLRVYGLKDGALHDRYILIVGKDGLPVSGFNLSNSIQKSNENYPLLITPIPADILLRVLKYVSGLLKQATEGSSEDEAGGSKVQMIFDSKSTSNAPRKRYEPLAFLHNSHAGDVLAAWTGEQSLCGHKGESLKQRMRELGLLNEESLALKDVPGLGGCLGEQVSDFSKFMAKWEVLGEVLANSPVGDMLDTAELSTETAFLNFLAQFLSNSFGRVHAEEVDAPIAVVASSFFQESLDALLTKPYLPHHFFHPVKYVALTWPEYFAVKILWAHNPDALISITEAQASTILPDGRQTNTVMLSLLSQIVSEIALGAEFGLRDAQRDKLIQSTNGLLKWMGLNALESQLRKQNGVHDVVQYTSSFNYRERIKTLGWMTNHLAGYQDMATIFQELVESLHNILPQKITAEDANLLVDSLRGHMRSLAWCEPWIFQDVVEPLLADARVVADDLCRVWTKELVTSLEDTLKDRVGIFKRNAEGRVVEVAAYLFSRSGLSQQKAVIDALQRVLGSIRRDIQQPLASTLNWNKWDTSLFISMWILAFTKWASHHMSTPSGIESKLENLSNEAHLLALFRPVAEWKSDRSVTAELAEFIEEVGEI